MLDLNAENLAQTELAENISDEAISFSVKDASVLPDAPFRAFIFKQNTQGEIIAFEVVEVGSVEDNTLSDVERGLEGTTALAWSTGDKFANVMTAEMYTGLATAVKAHLSDNLKQIAKVVSVEAFGAKGDGVTDDTDALLDTKAYVLANGGIFYIPQNFICKVTNSVDLMGIRSIQIEGEIVGNVNDELIIGYDSRNITPTNFFINKVTGMTIKIQGVKNGNTTINYAPHVLLWADGDIPEISSIAYSKFSLGYVEKLEFNSQGGAIGWINENQFFGGRFQELVIDGNYPHNHNIFYNPTFEYTTVHIKNGSSNHFYNCRMEGTNALLFDLGSHSNIILQSWTPEWGGDLNGNVYANPNVTITDMGINNNFISQYDLLLAKDIIYAINPQSENINLDHITRNEHTLELTMGWNNLFETDFIKVDKALGFQFYSDEALFRLQLYIYDENKLPITTEPENFVSMSNKAWNPTGFYSTTTNLNYHGIAFTPHPEVKFIKFVIVNGGVGTFTELKVLKIESNKILTPIPIITKQVLNSSTIPSEGYFRTGEYVYNNTPTIQGSSPNEYIVKGWMRLTTGTNHVLGVDWFEDRTGSTGL